MPKSKYRKKKNKSVGLAILAGKKGKSKKGKFYKGQPEPRGG